MPGPCFLVLKDKNRIERINTMAEEKKTADITELKAAAERDEEYVIGLKKPYVFEGKEYTEIDLSGIKKMTIKDAIDAQKSLFNGSEIAAIVLTEASASFARAIAAKATGLPIEFFELARLDISRAVKSTVMGHMTLGSGTEKHVMKLEEPYTYKGKGYTEIDMSRVGELTSLDESRAENRMAEEGVAAANAQQNFIYACVIASMATGLPEEFFTGMPLREVMKLKAAVNDSSFFE